MRDRRSSSDGFSEYLAGFHALPERRCALRFKASAATSRVFFTKERLHHESMIQESYDLKREDVL